jgi:spore coat polysaccharide biosynthesis protein SpsF (cytidylyltransferase family)
MGQAPHEYGISVTVSSLFQSVAVFCGGLFSISLVASQPVKTLGIIQARTSSSRLPGKVLMPIIGRAMIEYQIERVLRAQKIDKLILATTTGAEDDALEIICDRMGIDCFRGSRNNVLERFCLAAEKYQPAHVVRLTGDCPLSDSRLIDEVITFYLKSGCDYVANCITPCFPDGLDVEIFTFKALQDAYANAVLPSHLEHVTPYIRQESLFKVEQFPSDCTYAGMRWTVDEYEDFLVIERIFSGLYPANRLFDWRAVLSYVNLHPELKSINRRFARNEGMRSALDSDRAFLNDGADSVKELGAPTQK